MLNYACFANQELFETLFLWFLPLVPGFTNPVPYDFDAVEAGKMKSLDLLDKLETFIEAIQTEEGATGWLVGDGPTLADIYVAIGVSMGLQWVLDGQWRDGHPAIMHHFELVKNWEPVRTVVPEFVLIEETRNAKPAALLQE